MVGAEPMRSTWAEQLDELVAKESYGDALALLNVVEDTALPGKVRSFLAFN